MKLKYKISFLKRNQNEINGVRVEYFATNNCNISFRMYSTRSLSTCILFVATLFATNKEISECVLCRHGGDDGDDDDNNNNNKN